jgi:hypothetical protein
MNGSEVLETTVTTPGRDRKRFFFENGMLTREE